MSLNTPPITRDSPRTFYVGQHRIPTDPGARLHEDFPFNEVADRLDGTAPDDTAAELAARLAAALAWVVEESGKRMSGAQREAMAGRRAIVLAWVINPGLVGGRSLRDIAEDLGASQERIAQMSGHVSRLLGRRHAGQAHAWNWTPESPVPPHAQN